VRFSERQGYKKVRDVLQLESVDEPLRNALWTVLDIFAWRHAVYSSDVMGSGSHYLPNPANKAYKSFCNGLYHNFFKLPLDTAPSDWGDVRSQLRKYHFSCEWFEVYDLVEFVSQTFSHPRFKDKEFMEACNDVLEREMSAYRFIDGKVTPITDKMEIEQIETAADIGGPVAVHLQRSVQLLSDRLHPDYRNSVKESISAIECLVSQRVGEKGTLSTLLKKLEVEGGLHPALKEAFQKLYAYAGDAGGIRHALMDAEVVRFEDAKFFLVACSAFANLISAKASR
jgi:hypothetical protein